MLLRQAPFVMALNAVALVLGVGLSWTAAVAFGLAGAAAGSTLMIYLDRIVTLWRISKISGVPIRRQQDWRKLALLALFAVAAGLFAWGTVMLYFSASGPLVRLLVGGTALALAYAAAAAASGLGGVWLATVRSEKHGT
jgi:hypothetical protein